VSATRIIRLHCNHPNCTATIDTQGILRNAIAAARLNGWAASKRHHRCPTHAHLVSRQCSPDLDRARRVVNAARYYLRPDARVSVTAAARMHNVPQCTASRAVLVLRRRSDLEPRILAGEVSVHRAYQLAKAAA
jgi:hypothetical protein